MINTYLHTRGQRPNESQKGVIIDMMKYVGEIASKIWPVLKYSFNYFQEILTFESLDAHHGLYLGTKYEVCR